MYAGAGLFVTVDRWDGFDHAGLARSIAPRLPEMVVHGHIECPH